MKENYTGDCYICSMENLDTICETLIKKECNITNIVPIEYNKTITKMYATKLCITFERPKTTKKN